jgi:tRNA(Ile)-lysidine synthase
MIERWFFATLARHDMVRPGDRVLIAVSGGPDSTALLTLFRRAAPRLGVELHVAHLDHGWRGRGAARDAEFVRRMALRMGLPVTIGHAGNRTAPAAGRRQSSREAIGRALRMRVLMETAAAVGAARVALGHTLDDQAETILMRLARGAGPSALLGMRVEGPGPIVRPLLSVERADLRAWLKRKRIAFRDDPSNRDPRFDRNFVRLKVLPLLRALNPQAARHIVDGMARLRDDVDYLDALAREAFGHESSGRLPAVLGRRIARLIK